MNCARTRSFPETDIGIDHDLLVMTFHIRLKRISKPKHTRLKFDLKKLKDSNVLETFQAMIGGKFAPLTIMDNEDTDLNSMITTFNTAVIETASEILGKYRQNIFFFNWVTADILVLCDERRELRKKRFEPEGSEKYKEVNNIKRCMKKGKKWTGEQCREIEETFRKNNSKRAYQLVKDLTTGQGINEEEEEHSNR